jgi:uncharacterized repeat protein (TIGR01451 family)
MKHYQQYLARCVGVMMLCGAGMAYAAADVEITKSVDKTRVNSGDTVEYTIIAANKGDTVATAVNVTDLLPGGLSYIGDNEVAGQYNSATGVWVVGDLSAGQQKILKIITIIN